MMPSFFSLHRKKMELSSPFGSEQLLKAMDRGNLRGSIQEVILV